MGNGQKLDIKQFENYEFHYNIIEFPKHNL